MKTFHYIALALTALLLVTSCAIDEMWSDVEPADEQKVLTFKPKFEDFETVTKAIGDGSKVDELLVQVYEENGETPVFSDVYDRDDWNKVQIAFYYGKTYKVYFWAYDSNAPFTAYKYTIINGEIQLNKPIEINYHQNDLAYNTLESLDAFYSVQTVNLSATDKKENTVKLYRPFAQVNLGALAKDFDDAQVSKAVFKVKDIPSVFTLSDSGVNADDNSETITSPSFTFTDFDLDRYESQITFDNTDYRYIGTTYILVPSLTDKVTVDVAIYGQDSNNPMKEATVELTVGSNKCTNLIFKEIAPSWNDSLADSSEDVPSTETDGWIHITKPEELAALLIYGGTEGKKYHICANLDMNGMPPTTASQIGLAESGYRNLTIDAGIYNDHKVTGLPVGGGSYMLKNINGLKAFFGIASDLHIQNVILDNVNVSGDTHVGVLVNSLSGENTFTNVTIQNSSAETSSGAAGGMIGYVVRSKEDRIETLSVTIDGCKVNNTSASGTLAEGKFVGLLSGYDNGEQLVFTSSCSTDANTSVTDWTSPYKEGNEGVWLASNNYSSYDGWLGDEVYYRGKVYFGGTNEATNRFCRKWDGTTTVEPLLANASYDAGTTEGTNRFVVYSPFDLAGVRKKTASPAALYLMTNVDMFGQGEDGNNDAPDPYNSSTNYRDDCLFNPFETISYLDGLDNTIYNLSIEQIHNSNLGGTAFIRRASGQTTHKNIVFYNPNIKAYSKVPTEDGNAYAGTLICTASGTYNAENIKVVGGNIFSICKTGGLCGRISDATTSIKQCSIDGMTFRNYDTSFSESFLDTEILGQKVNISFKSDGEVGGLIGFIVGSNATISSCAVKNCNFYCTGEDDWTLNMILAAAKVPGRHVNQFIGDIRTTKGETIKIDDYKIDNNNMHTTEKGENGEKFRNDKYKEFKSRNAKTWDCVGFVYAVTIKFNDEVGTVKINNSSVMVSESMRK